MSSDLPADRPGARAAGLGAPAGEAADDEQRPWPSPQEVIDFCKARLADFKCPKTVRFVEDIPKGPTGKLLKRELAQMFR